METLKEGVVAPKIEALNQLGEAVSLSQYKGKKVILFFYPKDNTPGCTAESCNLRDNYSLLKKHGFEIIGISIDSQKSHQNFISKYSLPFNLIADTDKKVVTDYGVWVEKKNYGKTYMGIQRTTFIINEEGVVEKIFTKVDTKNHAEQIINELNKK